MASMPSGVSIWGECMPWRGWGTRTRTKQSIGGRCRTLAHTVRAGEFQSMNARPYVLAESTWKTVDATPYDVAVLSWGATEAENYHLPYATDNIQSEALAVEAARRAWERGAKV